MRSSFLRVSVAIIGCISFLLLFSQVVHAQFGGDPTSVGQLIKQYATFGARIFKNELRPAFAKVLSAEEMGILDDIEFRWPSDFNLLTAYASRDANGNRIVVISGGHIAAADAAIDANLIAVELGKGDPPKYFDHMLDLVKQNRNLYIQGSAQKPLPSFENFFSLNNSEVQRIRAKPSVRAARDVLMTQSLAFVVAHELAHHVLGHIDSPVTSLEAQRERERAADAYAVKLVTSAGYNPIAVAAFMGLLSSLEGSSDTWGESDHPRALCRQADFLVNGYSTLSKDSEYEKFLQENPDLRNKFRVLGAQVPGMKKFYEICCSFADTDPRQCDAVATAAGYDLSYCLSLSRILNSGVAGFEGVQGEKKTDTDKERWNGLELLPGSNGCSVRLTRGTKRYVCDIGYLDSANTWQNEYERQVGGVQSCGSFVDLNWDLVTDQEDLDGEYSTLFVPDNDVYGTVDVQKIKTDSDKYFVRMTFRQH